MAELIGNYKITTSNGSRLQKSSLRVYRGAAVLAIIERDPMGNLLTRVRRHPDSLERKEFVNKLLEQNVPQEDIKMLLEAEKGN